MVAKGGIEPPTRGFSVLCSTKEILAQSIVLAQGAAWCRKTRLTTWDSPVFPGSSGWSHSVNWWLLALMGHSPVKDQPGPYGASAVPEPVWPDPSISLLGR